MMQLFSIADKKQKNKCDKRNFKNKYLFVKKRLFCGYPIPFTD